MKNSGFDTDCMATILSHTTSLQLLNSSSSAVDQLLLPSSLKEDFLLNKTVAQWRSTALSSLPSSTKPGNAASCKAWAQLYHLDLPLHVLISDKSQRTTHAHCINHCMKQLPEDKHYLRIEADLLACSPELSFVLTAPYLPFPSLLCLGFELCGFYSVQDCGDGFTSRRPLTSVNNLMNFISSHSNLYGAHAAGKAARYLIDGSASPAETTCAILLSLPCRLGGYGIPQPNLNHRVSRKTNAALDARIHAPSATFARCDLSWDGVVLEYDSRQEHGTYDKMEKDARRRNDLTPHVTVLQATTGQLASLDQTDHLARLISQLLGFRMQPRMNNYRQRQVELRWALNAYHKNSWLKSR